MARFESTKMWAVLVSDGNIWVFDGPQPPHHRGRTWHGSAGGRLLRAWMPVQWAELAEIPLEPGRPVELFFSIRDAERGRSTLTSPQPPARVSQTTAKGPTV